jgi:hypothetical protein
MGVIASGWTDTFTLSPAEAGTARRMSMKKRIRRPGSTLPAHLLWGHTAVYTGLCFISSKKEILPPPFKNKCGLGILMGYETVLSHFPVMVV